MYAFRLSRLVVLLLAAGASPALATVATDFCPLAADPCVVNTTLTIAPGSVIDLGTRALQFGSAARVTVGVGSASISAGAVRVLAGPRVTGDATVGNSRREITLTGNISVEAIGSTKSRIDMSAELIAGTITLHADGGITVAGDIAAAGRDQDADGGLIMLEAAAGDVAVGGSLAAQGGSLSGGGSI